MPERDRRAARTTARDFFERLLARRECLDTWEKAPLEVKDELVYLLESRHEWLCYCHGHWKARMVPTNSYSQWYKKPASRDATKKARGMAQESTTATTSKLAEVEPIEVDDSDNGDSNGGDIEEGRTSSLKRPRTEDEGARPTKQPRLTLSSGMETQDDRCAG